MYELLATELIDLDQIISRTSLPNLDIIVSNDHRSQLQQLLLNAPNGRTLFVPLVLSHPSPIPASRGCSMYFETQAPTPANAEAMGLLPPHSIEAEQSTIGALMLDNSKWDEICEIVDADAFYGFTHRRIFTALAELAHEDKPLDVVTLSEVLERDGQLESIGGLAYLAELARNTPSASNIVAYANIVREHQRCCQLANMGRDLSQRALEPEANPVGSGCCGEHPACRVLCLDVKVALAARL